MIALSYSRRSGRFDAFRDRGAPSITQDHVALTNVARRGHYNHRSPFRTRGGGPDTSSIFFLLLSLSGGMARMRNALNDWSEVEWRGRYWHRRMAPCWRACPSPTIERDVRPYAKNIDPPLSPTPKWDSPELGARDEEVAFPTYSYADFRGRPSRHSSCITGGGAQWPSRHYPWSFCDRRTRLCYLRQIRHPYLLRRKLGVSSPVR